MSSEAIKLEHITKVYKLYNRNRDRLKDSLGLTKKKCYTEHFALRDVSMEIHQGETVGIIGVNGSGKSTILKIITGVLSPTSGTMEINGRISALLELGAGFNMEYSGIENVYLNGSMIGFYALIYMYIGFCNGFLYKIFFDEDVKVPMVLVAGSDIAYGVLVYGLQFMLRGRLDFFSYLQHIILPEMVYTVLLTAVLYRPLYRLNRWLTENEWEGPKLP